MKLYRWVSFIVTDFEAGFGEISVLFSIDTQKKEILNYIDVLVDGKFEYDKIDLNSNKFRGSTNQNYIEIKKVRLSYHI